jgi:photosystem II stability/assembly factor-like uncharacterized protein
MLLGLPACALVLPGRARAAITGIEVLDNPAISVKSPSAVFLIAIVRVGTRLIAAGEHGVIIYSDDVGATWQQASVPVDVTLTCLTFSSPARGWAAGHFGIVLQTMDAGATWHEQLNGIEANQLTLAAAEQAATVAPNSLGTPLALRRANKFMQAGPANPFLSILALTSLNVIVFGAYRLTMMTRDGGQTWVDWSLQIGDRYSNNLYAVAQIGSDIFIAAEEGLVFRSSDGGQSFPAVTSPSAVTLFGLTATATGHVVVFGVAGSCYRSTDRGETWQAVNITVQDNLTAGCLRQDGAIVLCSESGGVFVSHDDGVSFVGVAGTPPMAVAGIALADHGVVCVGQTGVTRLPAGLLTS